jgi:hypothetical protein
MSNLASEHNIPSLIDDLLRIFNGCGETLDAFNDSEEATKYDIKNHHLPPKQYYNGVLETARKWKDSLTLRDLMLIDDFCVAESIMAHVYVIGLGSKGVAL